MSKTLIELIDAAISDIDTYKNPDVRECREQLNPIMLALDIGSTGDDRISQMYWDTSWEGKKVLRITTQYSLRGCAMEDDYEVPYDVLAAEDPLHMAQELNKSEKLRAAKSAVEKARKALVDAEQALQALQTG